MPHRNFALLTLLLLVAGPAWVAAPSPPAPPLVLSSCRLEHPSGLSSLEAECGHLAVPENRAIRGGRQLQLFVARIPSLSRRHAPEPLFILAGGPGLGASTFYTGVAPVFARIRRTHDIIIVDQRGTGKSHPLNCPFDEQQLLDASEAETVRIMRDCRINLARDHDLAQYTTSVAVQDLEAVRQQLGYARIALYGSSYGTRVAQQYARRYPQHTHAVILDGVVPPTQVLGITTPLDAENALQKIFARCRADAACAKQFGNPEQDYQQLRTKLATAAIPVTLTDPHTGLPTRLSFTTAVFAGALRLASYSDVHAALLPLTLHLANDRGEYGPLAAQYLLAAASYDAVLAYGMHNSVVCTEDVPFFGAAHVDRRGIAETFLGFSQLDSLRSLCSEWPIGVLDADLHQPLASGVPALLLSGTADPVTPASFGAEAARGFSSALHLQLADQGHGQLIHSCMDLIMANFLQGAGAGKTQQLDHSCTDKLRPAPFFLSVNGPAP
ncbi:MAG: alpha/beta fold hydrolase [Steroidobacteraceae bacterium]